MLLSQFGDALAAARSATVGTREAKKVVTNVTVNGPVVKCHQWGFLEVQLNVTKTETSGAGGKPAVAVKIDTVTWPIFPNHTSRSIYINQQALPLLQGETMQLQAASGTKLISISGASQTSVAWRVSLQAALLKAETP